MNVIRVKVSQYNLQASLFEVLPDDSRKAMAGRSA